jgi:hypothetical protein
MSQEEPIMEWQFEKRAQLAEPQGEINVLHNKLVLALQMLTELGYRDEFNRLAEKFIREKTA